MALTRSLRSPDPQSIQQSVTFAIERHSLAALSQRKLNALASPLAYVDRNQRYRFANRAFLREVEQSLVQVHQVLPQHLLPLGGGWTWGVRGDGRREHRHAEVETQAEQEVS